MNKDYKHFYIVPQGNKINLIDILIVIFIVAIIFFNLIMI